MISEVIQSWILAKSLQAAATCVTNPVISWSRKSVISVIVSLVEPELYTDLLYSIVGHIEEGLNGSICYVVEGHICSFARIYYESSQYQIFISPISSVSLRKDEPLTKFLEAKWSGLKVARDGLAMRTLLIPRLYSLMPADVASSAALQSAMKFAISWGKERGIWDDSDDGYLTQEIIFAMMLYVYKKPTDSSAWTDFSLIRSFFTTYADWDYNEASIASQVCSANIPYASTIHEDEGIDSDVDDQSRAKRISQRQHAASSVTSPADEPAPDEVVTNGHPSLKQDEDDEVQVHKRNRADLGRIRDMRRFYTMNEAGEQYFAKPVVGSSVSHILKPLDWLDVMQVGHPYELTDYVNLAIRVQESNKKIILQEILRARMLLEDVRGREGLSELSTVICQPITREVPFNIVISVRSETSKISEIVRTYLAGELWFLVQELQAWEGLLVIPPRDEAFSLPADKFPFGRNLLIGLAFVAESPYRATSDLKMDFMGPLMRATTRCRERLRRRPDYGNVLENRFEVKCALVK